MKLVVRTIGGFLVAALAVLLVIFSTSETLIPQLSQYVSNTFPSEKSLEFVSTVAADPAPEHSEPSDGEVYETKQYTYIFDAAADGWKVSVNDKNKARYPSLFGMLYGKPVVSMNETFKDCEFLTQAPAVPSGVKDLTSTFEGCSSLTGMLTIFAEPTTYDGCFAGTTQKVSLAGTSTLLSELSSTSSAGNVSVK